ncbi:MAG: 50S ribosomal protein L37ae [Candidatus Thermoplasmatota archaeon]
MAKKKKVDSTGRFGSRYGVKVKESIKEIEEAKKKEYECPRCSHQKVKRESTGIWNCSRCGLTFAGGAYDPQLGKKIQRIVDMEE